MERLRFGAICLIAAVGTGCGSAPPRPPLLPVSVTANYLAGALAREADDHTAAAAAFALVVALPITDELGFAAGAVFIVWQWLRKRKQ